MNTLADNALPLVPLSSAIRHRKEFIEIDEFETYKRCRVQLHAKGIVLRDVITGSEIKTKKQQVCRAGEFLVAEIDAKVGGFGVVPADLDEAIVSSHYFLFEIDEDTLDRRFLDYFVRTPAFRDQVSAQGSTNYAAIRPAHVLEYKMPLPPLPEQRRIVARIEELAARIEDTRGLRRATSTEIQAMLTSAYRRIVEGTRRVPMFEVAPLHRRSVMVEPHGSYPELGVRSFGKGTFHKPSLSGLEVGSKKLFRIEPGDLLFNIVFAWEGAVAIARPEDNGRVGSHRFLTCVPEAGLATPEFLRFHFLTSEGLAQLGKASPGGAGRNRTLGQKALKQIEVPVPYYEEQQWFTSLIEKVDTLRGVQHDADMELDALLPSVLDRAFKGKL